MSFNFSNQQLQYAARHFASCPSCSFFREGLQLLDTLSRTNGLLGIELFEEVFQFASNYGDHESRDIREQFEHAQTTFALMLAIFTTSSEEEDIIQLSSWITDPFLNTESPYQCKSADTALGLFCVVLGGVSEFLRHQPGKKMASEALLCLPTELIKTQYGLPSLGTETSRRLFKKYLILGEQEMVTEVGKAFLEMKLPLALQQGSEQSFISCWFTSHLLSHMERVGKLHWEQHADLQWSQVGTQFLKGWPCQQAISKITVSNERSLVAAGT